MKFLIGSILTISTLLLSAQPNLPPKVADSLWGIWKNKNLPDTIRIDAMYQISWDGYLFSKPDSAFHLAQLQLDCALKGNHYGRAISALTTQGSSKYIQGDYDGALKYYQKCYDMSESNGIKKGMANSLNNIGLIYRIKGNFEKCLKYYKKSSVIQQQIGNKVGIANTYNNVGLIYAEYGKKDSAMYYLNKALTIRTEIDDYSGVAASLNNISNVYKEQGDIENAIKSLMKSLKINSEINNYEIAASVSHNIGQVYLSQKDYQNALSFTKQSYEFHQKLNNINGMANTLSSLGIVFSEMGNNEKAKKNYLKSLSLYKGVQNSSGIATVYNNLGTFFFHQKNLDSALFYLNNALSIADTISDAKTKVSSLNNIGKVYMKKQNYQKANFFCLKAFDQAKKMEFIEELKNASLALWEINKELNNPKKALEMYETYIQMKDSIESEENQRAVIQQEYKYQYEKQAAVDSIANVEKEKIAQQKLDKQKALAAQQKAEIKQKRTQQYALFGGLSLLLIFSGFVYNRFRITRKQKGIIEEQKSEVESQKQAAETQRDIAQQQRQIAEEQKHQVEEKNKEIMDSITYAKRLQEAILPPPRLVKEWLTDSFLFYKPKDIVAGDFYWMETVDTEIDGRKKTLIFFAAADCTGHGVPGAMVSVVCANALNRAVKEFQLTQPGPVLDKVTELVIESFEQSEEDIKDGMDIALCALDISSKKLYYSGANNPLWIITEKNKDSENKYINESGTHELIEYKATKQPVGKYEGQKQFETQEIQLKPGDAMYIFSDGFADQFGGDKGKKYKYANFKRFLLENYSKHMEEQKRALEMEFENWRKDLEQIDDVCIMGVRINGKERNNFTPRELEVLEFLKEGLPSKLIADKMGISTHTVDTYRRRLLAKTGTFSTAEMLNYCLEKEII